MSGHYNPYLVLLSVLIAVGAAYAALDLAGQISVARGRARMIWLAAGASAMGLGIWSMHYVGMQAFELPTEVLYHLPTVVASLGAAVLASAVALWVSSRAVMGFRQAIPAAVVMGIGISTMHYSGMSAMRLAADVRYNPWVVAASVAIAITVSLVALWRAFALRADTGLGWNRQKLLSACVMGAAIPAMHYTAMAGVRFLPATAGLASSLAVDISTLGLGAIVLSTFVVLALVIITSVVNRKLTAQDEAIRSNDLRFRALVEQSGDAIVLLDAKGVVTFATGAINRVLGFAPVELVGRSVFEFIDPADALRTRREIFKLRDNPEHVVHMEGSYQRKDGSWRVGEASLTNRLHHPAVRGLVLNFRDATDRVHLEEQLRMGQKMEAVGRLAGGIAHDFNNLLTAITGYADLLLEGADSADQRSSDVVEIKRAAVRAAELTRQLLAFSRKQVLQPRIVNLNGVVSGVDRMLARMIGEDIALSSVLASDLANTEVDPSQFEQVLMALVVNARAAMPTGGTIRLETRNVSVDEVYIKEHGTIPPGEYVQLSITDSGIGMNEETRKRIFDPFFTTKSVGESAGLGLAMVYGIIQQSNGFIWVYSEPGLGTTFKLFLPRVAHSALTAEYPLPVAMLRGQENVLIAEDELSVQKLTRKVLERQGYAVQAASDGQEALELASEPGARVDLLVTDVIMPRMGGRELADRLAALHPKAKVLFVSGYSDDAISRHGILEPGFAFLEKPFTADALTRKIRDVLDASAPAGARD